MDKAFDLEERSYNFALKCRDYVAKIPSKLSNLEYCKQLIRSSGSQAANYIEANEALSTKDFQHRIKICRKESKESRLWLRLIQPKVENKKLLEDQAALIQEALELTKIYSSIYEKSKSKAFKFRD